MLGYLGKSLKMTRPNKTELVVSRNQEKSGKKKNGNSKLNEFATNLKFKHNFN